MGDEKNLVIVSAVVAWEVAIKRSLGKLETGDVQEAIQENDFEPLAITVEHARAVENLPAHHRDSFDRMLIAQAMVHGLTLVSRDAEFTKYSIPLLVA